MPCSKGPRQRRKSEAHFSQVLPASKSRLAVTPDAVGEEDAPKADTGVSAVQEEAGILPN